MSRVFPGPSVKACNCCRHALSVDHEHLTICRKKGLVERTYVCRSFRYNPLARQPAALPVLEQHKKEEFEL